MDKKELLKHIGSIEQIGGVRDFILNDGKAKGVRAIEVNTGKLRFTVLPDRCLDIAQADFKGDSISWISKTGITSPHYYEKDGKNWLRGFYGGLVTTCGLKNLGSPVGEQGLHGRIANIPAQKVSIFADWLGDDYVMKISGEMRESVVFGENLVLKRTISAKLFEDKISVCDTIINEGFYDEGVAICYHCNFGYPLVCPEAKIVNVPKDISEIAPPTHGSLEKCINVNYDDEIATAGIENGKIGAYITYKTDTLPDFLVWQMFGESEYVVGLEPRTTSLGGQNIIDKNKLINLKPFEEYTTNFEISVKDL